MTTFFIYIYWIQQFKTTPHHTTDVTHYCQLCCATTTTHYTLTVHALIIFIQTIYAYTHNPNTHKHEYKKNNHTIHTHIVYHNTLQQHTQHILVYTNTQQLYTHIIHYWVSHTYFNMMGCFILQQIKHSNTHTHCLVVLVHIHILSQQTTNTCCQ